jgi:GNAT superfamily N-acetyltransferase
VVGPEEQLVQLLNQELGDGLYSVDRVLRDTADKRARVRHVAHGDVVVAGSVSRLMERSDLDYYARFGPGVAPLFRRPPIGSLEAVAVAPKARRAGIGSRLVEDALTWFRREDCRVAVAVSWISGRTGASARLFAGAGFSPGPRVEGFYLEESLRGGWSCPVCAGPCHCPAQFFHRDL